MRRCLPAVCALAVMAPMACREGTPRPTRLQAVVQKAKFTAPCDRAIPMEWFQSQPVPTGGAGGREFKIFFYPSGKFGSPDFVNAPLGEAVLNSGGEILSCIRLPGEETGLSAVRWPAALGQLSVDDLEKRLDELYAATEQVSVLYSSRAPITEAARATLQRYSQKFRALAEPALLGYYYGLNPDFWEWLNKSGAPTLAKP